MTTSQHEKEMSKKERSSLGAFYTPDSLIKKLIDVAFEGYGDRSPEIVIDPACGDGRLLDAALKNLAWRRSLIREEPDTTIIGIDKDPEAIRLAKERFHGWGHFREADSLFLPGDDPRFFARGPIAVVMNPPYLGGGKISGAYGDSYLKKLKERYKLGGGQADLCSYFVRAMARIIERNGHGGTMSMIVTKTISQRDTRENGLRKLVSSGWRIWNATRNVKWPDDAKVTVSLVHAVYDMKKILRRKSQYQMNIEEGEARGRREWENVKAWREKQYRETGSIGPMGSLDGLDLGDD